MLFWEYMHHRKSNNYYKNTHCSSKAMNFLPNHVWVSSKEERITQITFNHSQPTCQLPAYIRKLVFLNDCKAHRVSTLLVNWCDILTGKGDVMERFICIQSIQMHKCSLLAELHYMGWLIWSLPQMWIFWWSQVKCNFTMPCMQQRVSF